MIPLFNGRGPPVFHRASSGERGGIVGGSRRRAKRGGGARGAAGRGRQQGVWLLLLLRGATRRRHFHNTTVPTGNKNTADSFLPRSVRLPLGLSWDYANGAVSKTKNRKNCVSSIKGEDDIVLGPTARGAPHLPYLGTESDGQGSSPAHWQVSVGLVL
ncbi:hypothetical protein EYF80_003376 [Liparis tanakae]|uniref:Uncharacterized protein n=1 Tax=Liparis tanakae TaxID=230148 RepID=A0A4Z2J8R1_9TELE|nr:hypothetical protein EYF80_003376 [Liparis tanakae]